jgi:hypothetical protein
MSAAPLLDRRRIEQKKAPAIKRHFPPSRGTSIAARSTSIDNGTLKRRTMTQAKPAQAASPSREHNPSDKPHAPGSGTPLHTIPDEQADRVVPRDPRETQAHAPGESSHPGGSPYPPEHDKPDQSGNRPKPL